MRTRRQTELSEVIRAGMGIQARGGKKKKKKNRSGGVSVGGYQKKFDYTWVDKQTESIQAKSSKLKIPR